VRAAAAGRRRQISPKGLDALRQVSRVDKDAVHRVVFSPQRNLMLVTWDGERYFLKSEGCVRRALRQPVGARRGVSLRATIYVAHPDV
jgi:hypothetical protein